MDRQLVDGRQIGMIFFNVVYEIMRVIFKKDFKLKVQLGQEGRKYYGVVGKVQKKN